VKRLALVAFFLVAACGSIGVHAQTISLGYKAGDVSKYALHMVLKYTVGASGMSIPIDLDVTAKEAVTVKSVDTDGTADLSIAISDIALKTSMNGTTSSTNTTKSGTIEVKIAKDGRVLSVNGDALSRSAFPGLSGPQSGYVSAILPDHPVKPGDTWTKSYDAPNTIGTGAIHATSDNTYLRDEKVGSVNAAVIESKINTNLAMNLDIGSMLGQPDTSTASGGSLSMTGTSKSDTTSWIDVAGHRIVKTHSTGTVDATLNVTAPPNTATTPGLTGPITLKGTQTLDLTPA
jgi:hypothetical protein